MEGLRYSNVLQNTDETIVSEQALKHEFWVDDV